MKTLALILSITLLTSCKQEEKEEEVIPFQTQVDSLYSKNKRIKLIEKIYGVKLISIDSIEYVLCGERITKLDDIPNKNKLKN